MESVIAIFDVGKINKNLFLLNRDYEIVHSESKVFKEIPDDDSFPSEDLESISRWIKVTFRDAFKLTRFNIEGLNFTTYGSAYVNIADNGKPITPLYNYLKPYPEDLLKEFFTKYGSQETITRQTASPALGFLNAGLQLFWLKYRKPELFKQIKYSLHFPQYLSYLFTGKTYSEITSIGCHTTLWDFEKQHPHDWVYKEKLMSLFPPLINTFNTVKIRYKSRQIPCGIGVHDSSAALIPYQLRFEEPFILVSTGTWSITLNPYSDEPLSFEELSRDCLSYINYKNQPVRASRLFLGKEHSYQRDRIAAHFRKDKEYDNSLKFDPDLIRKLIRENNVYKKFFPEMMVGTGPYPKRFMRKADLKLFDNFEEAYHQLMLDLISMQATSIELARGNSKIKKIFLAGRFCRNEIFVKLLASRFPEIEVYTPEHSSVTPLGAAITMHTSWNHEKDLQEVLRFTKWEPVPGLNLKSYKLVD